MKLQLEEFEEQITNEELFFLCFEKNNIFFFEEDKVKIMDHRKNKFNFESLKYLLLKTELEEYATLIYNYFLIRDIDCLKDDIEYAILNSPDQELSHKDIFYSSLEHNETLTRMLLYLLSNKDNDIQIFLKNRKYIDRCKLQSNYIVELLIDNMLHEYKNKGFNKILMNYDEAEEAVRKFEDREWICCYLENKLSKTMLIKIDDQYVSCQFVFNKFTSNQSIESWVNKELIDEYAQNHKIEKEVTTHLLELQLIQLEKRNKKVAGAKQKNEEIAMIVKRFSYLIRLNKFLNANTDVNIEEVKLSNNECNLIYEILMFYRIVKRLDDKNITTKPYNRIRSYMSNAEKYKDSKYKIELLHTEEKINDFKSHYNTSKEEKTNKKKLAKIQIIENDEPIIWLD
jgi:hypothetical protein